MLKSMFRKRFAPELRPQVPADVRVYAIGDIHGRLDLFEQVLGRIERDHDARAAKRPIVILLGDLIDRGPESAGVIARAIRLAASPVETHILAGNHEELLLLAYGGDAEAARLFTRVGGRETLLSYGVAPAVYERASYDEVVTLLREHISSDHIDFIMAMEDLVELGDYAFVHAGIRPGVALADQRRAHLRWIRGEFLDHRGPHPRFIVHGHTITEAVDERSNRIGIDTGAYASGCLTVLGLESDHRWFIDTA